ncbi:MAG TPA: hypothetical protein VGA61_00160 [Anaerolineae bacterium]
MPVKPSLAWQVIISIAGARLADIEQTIGLLLQPNGKAGLIVVSPAAT